MNQSHAEAMSATTAYHSFNDNELYEPASPPRRKQSPSSGHSSKSSSSSSNSLRKMSKRQATASRRSSQDDRPPTAPQMKRQDSGYESRSSTPRASMSHPNATRPSPPRRTSTSNVQGHMSSSSVSKTRGRPSTRRSMKQPPPQVKQQPPASLYLVQSLPSQRPASMAAAVPTTLEMSSYVQFPSPPDALEAQPHTAQHWHDQVLGFKAENDGSPFQHAPPPAPPPPPQTTHYWTSDRTRRLEYAAIDAASRGVKGWIRRNLLPDCFVPRDDGHIAFDDDTGSVRRYRLELEDDEPSSACKALSRRHTEKKPLSTISVVPRRMRTWQLWGSGGKGSDQDSQMVEL